MNQIRDFLSLLFHLFSFFLESCMRNQKPEKPSRRWEAYMTKFTQLLSCSFVELSLSLYASFRSRVRWQPKTEKKIQFNFRFHLSKVSDACAKIKLYTRRVNDTIGNSITHAMCMFIIYPFLLVCCRIGAITHSSFHGCGSAFMLNQHLRGTGDAFCSPSMTNISRLGHCAVDAEKKHTQEDLT